MTASLAHQNQSVRQQRGIVNLKAYIRLVQHQGWWKCRYENLENVDFDLQMKKDSNTHLMSIKIMLVVFCSICLGVMSYMKRLQ